MDETAPVNRPKKTWQIPVSADLSLTADPWVSWEPRQFEVGNWEKSKTSRPGRTLHLQL